MPSIVEDAHAVLFPAFAGTALSDAVRAYLDQGGISILIGESREEYVARRMSPERIAAESEDTFRAITREARGRSGLLLAAVDQEMGGICRLHDLVPSFPNSSRIASTSEAEIEDTSFEIAQRASGMGVNVFLAPILDVVTGSNPWLAGRTWSTNPADIARLSAAYVRGVQRGGVAATGKHFPGFASVTGDPAIDATAVSHTAADELERGFAPFRAGISAGVAMIMVGPAPVMAFDEKKAALRSPPVVSRLKVGLGFNGIVMADDLDSAATMRGDSVPQVAIDALKAGCDFLLLADIGSQVADVARAIVASVERGEFSREALASSANRMRSLARTYATRA